ncbi:aminotransferase class V-fold PLP-dependent enzyme [Pseudoramibacter sp.]|jgi:cysteine desulfurase/selenocysteine lyase|uniref:aminotransferase class V-fold PLP-dependent enzyme n=1 Tax=Pseudoramibacter sp. TaxID=2034862 RepID=UPI0025CE17B1|nr:cysteine desulfurase [Pseudoramibacter sp.]
MGQSTIDVEAVRKEFPVINHTDLAYLDNSATVQKPQCVLDAVTHYYQTENANPFRGLYDLSVAATDAYEDARQKVADFIHAPKKQDIIFTRNASESLNLVAYSMGRYLKIGKGDEILVSIAEHHSNMLPWRMLAQETGATVRYLNCGKDGSLTADDLKAAMTPNTRIVAIAEVSNVLGRVWPIAEFAKICHEQGAIIVVDGAQSVPHTKVDVTAMDCDFFAFSGHKMYAPMGIGVLYGKSEWLNKMPPFMTGGETIDIVTTDRIVWAEVPHRFEAGTVNVGGAVGLAAAIDFMQELGLDQIEARELELTTYAMERLKAIPHVNIIGADEPENHHGIIAFSIDGVHPHDITTILSENHIAVRAGHHCAEPLHHYLGVPSTTRASLTFYNTREEIDRLADTVGQIRKEMGYDE